MIKKQLYKYFLWCHKRAVFVVLNAKVLHFAGDIVDVPEDELAVPAAGGDEAHAATLPAHHTQLVHLDATTRLFK